MSDTAPEPAVEPEPDDGYSLEERVYRNQRIQDTANSEGWADICDVVKEKAAAAQHRLAFGQCKSMEDYRATSAEFEALIWVIGDGDKVPGIPRMIQAQLNSLRAQRAEDREGDEDE